MTGAVATTPLHLFSIRRAMQWQERKATSYRGQGAYAAPQPPSGAIISWWLREDAAGPVSIEVLDVTGRVVRHLEGSGQAGIQRIVWDLRLDPLPTSIPGRNRVQSGRRSSPNLSPWLGERLASRGPFVLPGRYTVRVFAESEVVSGTVEVIPDPLDPLTGVEREERWSFLLGTDTLYRQAGRPHR